MVARERELAAREPAGSPSGLATALRELDRELGGRMAELAAARAELDSFRFESAKREQELEARAAEAEEALADAGRESAELRARLEQLRTERATGERELTEARGLVAQLEADAAVSKSRVEALETELGRSADELRQMRDVLDQERQTRSSVEGRLAWHEQQLRVREAELAAAGRTISR